MASQSQDLEGEGGAGTPLGVNPNPAESGRSMSFRSVGSPSASQGVFESAASLGSRTRSGVIQRSSSKGKTPKGVVQLSRSRSQTREMRPTDDTQTSLVDHGEDDIDELYRCPLTKGATSEEKKKWIIKMGKHLLFTGSIALPVLKWDADNEEECLVSQSPCCENHMGSSTRF